MNYKELFFFVGHCLGLSLYPEREAEIRKTLQSGKVSWELLVWISSSHFVLPALYVQFRNYDLLKELPEDLVEHLEHLHRLNSERNENIRKQLFDIITALNTIDIAPIFLKGTAHLLDGLYSDVGERMIGDIDFIVGEKEVLPAVEKLREMRYSYAHKFNVSMLKEMKHYPRLQNLAVVAAVEVHRQPVSKPYDSKFNYALIHPEKKKLNIEGEAYVLSDKHQIVHNVMNTQMNDKAYKTKKIYLRNVYDLFLLSRREDTLKTSVEFAHYNRQFNAYIMVASKILGNPNQLNIPKDSQSHRYLKDVLFFMDHPRIHKMVLIKQYFAFRIFRYISLPIHAIYNKEERQALLWRLTNRNWYSQHFKSWCNIKI